MDPSFINNPMWTDIGKSLMFLWGFVFFVVLFAANLLLGHVLIPSLVATKHLPESFVKLRRGLYTVAILCFGVAIMFLAFASNFAIVVGDFWERWWI